MSICDVNKCLWQIPSSICTYEQYEEYRTLAKETCIHRYNFTRSHKLRHINKVRDLLAESQNTKKFASIL